MHCSMEFIRMLNHNLEKDNHTKERWANVLVDNCSANDYRIVLTVPVAFGEDWKSFSAMKLSSMECFPVGEERGVVGSVKREVVD